MKNFKLIWITLFLPLFSTSLFAAATFDNSVTAAQLAAQIQGTGITITNPVLTRGQRGGPNSQVATFSNGIAGANFQVDSGILLTASTASEAFSTNDSGRKSLDPGNIGPSGYDSDLMTTISQNAIFNQVVFEFDVTLDVNTKLILINYQFASDEYPEWVGSQFNDAFGFFVSGSDLNQTYNIARVVDDTTIVNTENISDFPPVNINNVNNGSVGNQSNGTAVDLTNSAYFIDNGGTDDGFGGLDSSNVVITSEFDGFTKKLHATLDNLTPGGTYHFKMAIADTSDASWDAGVFVAEIVGLRTPSLCYDYSYKQNDIYFTEDNNGSYTPTIVGDPLSTTDPITVELYIKSLEDSEITAQNLTLNIIDINTTQATYITGSTYLVLPNEVFPSQYTDINYSTSYNTHIAIGDVAQNDFFYVDYNLNPLTSTINMPINVTVDYEIDLHGLTVPNNGQLGVDIPLCSNDNFTYFPKYGPFNVENNVLSQTQLYNLPTQTANRAGDFVVTSYDPDNIHTRRAVATPISIELIDAGKYHGIDASCQEPDSALTPRIWTSFGTTADGNQSIIDFDVNTITNAIANNRISDRISGIGTPIATAGQFYGNARENTAFRISYNLAGTGDDIVALSPGNCVGGQVAPCYQVDNFPDLSQIDLGSGAGRCSQDIDGNLNSADLIPQYCGNSGNRGLDSVELATCMECIYGYNINYVCSRDNFATRPESFRMALNDQDQDNVTIQSNITNNNNTTLVHDASDASPNALQVVAGYNYYLEINATNHQNDNPTPGYHVTFPKDGNNTQRTLRLAWQTAPNGDTFCNDTSDQNHTTSFMNGLTDLNISSQQIGKYNLTILDKLWTRVDNDINYMTHHLIGDGAGYFLTAANSDCINNDSIVPVENASTNTYLQDQSGCDITTSNDTLTPRFHTNNDNGNVYTDIALRIHPYEFNVDGLSPKIGPYTRTNGQTFVYIDTPPTDDANNTNMSYNMNGTFFAAGYDSLQLSNFVDQCYADDVNMDLNFTYNSPEPAANKEPFLSYSLKDYNTTDSTVIYRPDQTTTADDFEVATHNSSSVAFTIAQQENLFVKDMRGAITMDLGYNFKRDYNKVLNPRSIEFKDFNITYDTNPTNIRADLTTGTVGDIFEINGTKELDQNVTFVYGRAKPSQDFYDDVTTNFIDTPISVVIYCDQSPITCSAVYDIETVLSKTDEFNWYLVREHNTSENDGNVTLTASVGANVALSDGSAFPIKFDEGVNNPNVRVTPTVTTRPLNINIDFDTTTLSDTNRWLIYNKDNNETPIPFYRVRFIGQSDWAGHGDTGHVVDNNITTKKIRRLGW